MSQSFIQPETTGDAAEAAGGRIVRIGADRRQEAVERLLASPDGVNAAAAERFLAFAEENRINLSWMWALLDDRDRIARTVLTVPNPGRTAMVFTTHPAGGRDVEPTAGLIDRACREMAESHVDLAQALLDPVDQLDREVFERASFRRLAMLSYMERPLQSARLGPPTTPQWPEDVTVEPYEAQHRDDLLAALDGSYQDTLDCPGLRGLRRTEDILKGHQSTGRFEAHLWTLLRVSGRPAGVLLLNPAPPGEKIELVYLGLIPEARGRGLGSRLLRHGLRQIHQRTESTVSLAVDEQNTPAIQLYKQQGFRRVMRRMAMIRSLADARKS